MSEPSLESSAALHQPWRPSFNPWVIAFSVMLATFMEVLDTSVANVALPHIAGSLSATTTEATWVLTSYLVSNAVVLPATGWLTSRFGRKSTLLTCVGIFTLASMACGAATSLSILILARIIQGVGGGALQPIAQAVLLESFPPARRGVAMAAYGVGVVVAPIIGPTLGGWITDNYTWRWIFYINLPVGLLAIALSSRYVEDPPYLRHHVKVPIDYVGLLLMIVGLGGLQVMLDKGQELDWFASPFIRYAALASGISLLAFVFWELFTASPIVDLRIFRHRNFAIGTVLITVVGMILYGTTALLPLFLQTLLGYPATESGLAVSPRGLGSIIAMIIVGRLVTRIDNRWLLVFGFLVLAYATYLFGSIDLDIAISSIQWPNIITGLSLGFIFVPLTTVAVGTIPNTAMRNATGLYNLMRNVGGSIGIALMTTLLSRTAQAQQVFMVSHLTPYDPVFQRRLQRIESYLQTRFDPVTAHRMAYDLLYAQVQQQSSALAYIYDFRLLTLLCLLSIPAVLLFKKVSTPPPRKTTMNDE